VRPNTAHRLAVYLEEEAVHNYRIAIDDWRLDPEARLREVNIAVRADEIRHRAVYHEFTDALG
jgi:ubiquinol oxidase